MENQYKHLLEIDYAGIQDKDQLENIITEHKAIIQFLIKQIHELNNIKEKEELEGEIIINKMQQNMLENTRQIINFKNMINQITEEHQKNMKQSEESKERIKKSMEAQHAADISDHNKKIEQLEQQYKNLKEYQELEADYISKIEELKQSLVTRQYQHHDNMNQEEKKQIRQNGILQNENTISISETKKNAFNFAKEIVYEQKSLNQEKNIALKAKLVDLQSELAKLKKERNDILSKRKEFKMNICLNQEELQEYKAVGSIQKAKIKANNDKIENLKAVIEEEVRKRELKISEKKKQRNQSIKSLKMKLLKLQREKDQTKVKLQKLKLLGETILNQRTQVEQFFIMALDACKKEIEADQSQVFTYGKQKEEKSYGDKVDIQDLAPKDKQRILTNLYTKLALGPS